MRVIVALAGAALALSLSGCDMRGGDQKQANCNCATTPVAPPVATTTPPPDMRGTVPPEEHRYYHHRFYRPRGTAYGGRHHGYTYWRKEYSEVSVAAYDYHSGSSSSYFGYTGSGGDYRGGHGEHDGGYRGADHGWIDGYGRGHGGYVGDAAHYESDGGRGHVWHGYDADCPDQH